MHDYTSPGLLEGCGCRGVVGKRGLVAYGWCVDMEKKVLVFFCVCVRVFEGEEGACWEEVCA